MKQYYVHTNDIESLKAKINVVYQSSLISTLAIVETNKKKRDILKIHGVFQVEECGMGKLCA